MKLKIDLHTHSGEDLFDRFIRHSASDLISWAIKSNYGALAITNHGHVFYDRELDKRASDNGLIMVPGMEANVSGKHVLLYTPKDEHAIGKLNAASIESNGNLDFDQVGRLKTQGIVNLVVVPHAYFPFFHSLRNGYFIELYADLIEQNWVNMGIEVPDLFASFNFLNFNQKAGVMAQKLGIPLIAGSDAHFPEDFGRGYSLVEAEPNLESILSALKSKDQSKIGCVANELSFKEYLFVLCRAALLSVKPEA